MTSYESVELGGSVVETWVALVVLAAGSAVLIASVVHLRSFVKFKKRTDLLFPAFEHQLSGQLVSNEGSENDEIGYSGKGKKLSRRHILPFFGLLAAAWAALASLKRPHD
jgi:hypothetical protein